MGALRGSAFVCQGVAPVASMSAEQRVTRARIAARTRHSPGDPQIDEARRELRASRLEDYIRRTVDAAPPLTAEQRDRLAVLLRPSPGGDTG